MMRILIASPDSLFLQSYIPLINDKNYSPTFNTLERIARAKD